VTQLRESSALAGTVVRRFGGRYSTELGIDVDAGDAEIERWFVASALFGDRIAARVVEQTFKELSRVGVRRIVDAAAFDSDVLVALLDAGGYGRYDFRTATRLQSLARVLVDRFGGDVARIGRRFTEPAALVTVLDELPSWRPTTMGLFLRELHGLWLGARLPLDSHVAGAAHHLGLLSGDELDPLAGLESIAQRAGCDKRDLEVALAHRRFADGRGGSRRVVLMAPCRRVPSAAARLSRVSSTSA
jgi:hypothetical protein